MLKILDDNLHPLKNAIANFSWSSDKPDYPSPPWIMMSMISRKEIRIFDLPSFHFSSVHPKRALD